MMTGPSQWLANATVDQIIVVVLAAAAGIGAIIGIAAYWSRHREEE